MTESSISKMKRNGARLFKNPPQPHMCIQDFIKGNMAPCYINVLSWDKIAMPRKPSLPVPLYGGMRVPPPRTKTDAVVFAVMVNPEVLRMSGKNADAKKRSSFIELLLDFIEAMNAGVVFTRHYSILKDRDITGELKEVWNTVLAIRENEQRPPQQETWIDVQPSISQFPQYPEQQQQQQQQQEYIPQPPQYHSNIAYGRTINNENMHYESYGHQNPIISKNEPIFISGHIVPQQYHGNVPRIALDRYNYRERGRDGQVVQNIIAAQHQFQPRQTWPQYMHPNSNTKYMHPNSNLPYGPATNTTPTINPSNPIKSFQPYTAYQQQQQQQQQPLPSLPPPLHMDNAMHIDIRRMQQQPQSQTQSQIQLNHVQSQYAEQSGSFNVQNNAHRGSRPHMGVAQKNNATKRQTNSSTHTSCTNCQTKEDQSFSKPKSPVKVLQRETLTERQNTINLVENNKTSVEKTEELKTVPVTDLDEDLKKGDDIVVEYVCTEKEDICNSELVRTVDEAPSCEEKHSIKLESCKMSLMETKEAEVSQQLTVQKNISKKEYHKFIRGNARTRRTPATKGDKHNSSASESPKRSQPTMNSIIKSVFKINPGASGEESSGKKKMNGQTRTTNGKAMCENEEHVQQGYTILKKETQEEMMSEIAQLSIQDCKEATEVAPVLS
ncbi:hypothetical protein P5V15_009958 [Pogonomyrmex californicus]